LFSNGLNKRQCAQAQCCGEVHYEEGFLLSSVPRRKLKTLTEGGDQCDRRLSVL
jgi:hypothetical protein